jgi:uncharacterized glyoxalase superfamily protein PhnB
VKTRLMQVRSNVQDLEKAIEWYSNILGFEVDGLWPPEKPVFAAFSAQEGAVFSIGVAEPVPSATRFNFVIQDVDALWEDLKDKAEIVEPLYDTPYGTRKFTIRDLDGNEIGFVRG